MTYRFSFRVELLSLGLEYTVITEARTQSQAAAQVRALLTASEQEMVFYPIGQPHPLDPFIKHKEPRA